MKIKYLLVCLIVFRFGLYSTIYGQEVRRDTTESNIVFQKHSFGLTMSALVNVNSAFQINYAYGLNERVRIKSELGYIYTSIYGNESNGIRIKPGVHYLSSVRSHSAIIIGVNYNYRYSTGALSETIFFPDESFFIEDDFVRRRTMHGIEAYFGTIIHFDSRFFIELGAGLGAFYLNVKDIGRMPEDNDNFSAFDIFPAGGYFLPMTSFHLSLNYVLGKLH